MLLSLQNKDVCDFGALLKQLDELDDKDYTPKKKIDLKENREKMSTHPDTATDANFSDFDNSDDDIGSLLADDDDDDAYAKKALGSNFSSKIPDKLKQDSGSQIKDKKINDQNISSKSSPKKVLSKSLSKEKDEDGRDALNEFLSDSSLPSFLKESKTASSNKGSQEKANSSSHDESKYLDELGFNQLSEEGMSSKTLAASSLKSSAIEMDNNSEEDDILKSIGSDGKTPNASRKQSDSFFDDFLTKLSPKHSPKKITGRTPATKEEHSINKDGDSGEEDILKSLESDVKTPASPPKRRGSFFDDFLKNISPKQSPKKSTVGSLIGDKGKEKDKKKTEEYDFENIAASDIRKSVLPPQKHSTPENRRESLIKQVSFKGLPDILPENESPVKEKSIIPPKIREEKKQVKSAPQPRRSERMGASNKDDTDWLNFFKESPKKTIKPAERPLNKKDLASSEKQPPANDVKYTSGRRKSSTAEWLGLSESNELSGSIEQSAKDKVPKQTNEDWLEAGNSLKISRPHTTPAASQRLEKQKETSDLGWLEDDSIERNKKVSVPIPPQKRTVATSKDKQSNVPSKESNEDVHPQYEREEIDFQNAYFNSTSNSNGVISSDARVVLPSKQMSGALPLDIGLIQKSTISHGDNALQTLINNYVLEKEQLVKSMEGSKLIYEERINSLEVLNKSQQKASEDSLKALEIKLKIENDEKVRSFELKLDRIQEENKLQEVNFKNRLEEVQKQNMSEIHRLKELHGQSIALMKQDHEDALLRLKRLKEQEIEAILSTQAHSRSLQNLTDQLEARASELASLQMKVEDRNQTTLREKQVLLDAKERDLKSLQNRLQKQLEDGDEERTRLQQLILRLENRLQKYTVEGEEDRWEVQQMKARLSVQQKYLDEEHKLKVQQVEREKEKIRLSQDAILHEQKTVLLQLAQERQQLTQEKIDMESLAKKVKEGENIFHVKRLKEESFIERQKQFIQQEENRLQFESNNIKQEKELLEQERTVWEREKQIVREEREKLNEFSFKIKRKENEMEVMAMSTAEERERTHAEHLASLKMKTEQESKMQQIMRKMQEVMEKEHHILAEKEKLSEEKLELENKKNSMVCNKCKLSLALPVNAPPSNTIPMSVPVSSINNTIPITAYTNVNGMTNMIPPQLDPSLIVWYITAQKDREYLQGELSFLRSLKDSSRNLKKLNN